MTEKGTGKKVLPTAAVHRQARRPRSKPYSKPILQTNSQLTRVLGHGSSNKRDAQIDSVDDVYELDRSTCQ